MYHKIDKKKSEEERDSVVLQITQTFNLLLTPDHHQTAMTRSSRCSVHMSFLSYKKMEGLLGDETAQPLQKREITPSHAVQLLLPAWSFAFIYN